MTSRSEARRAAGEWLGRNYPEPPVPYDVDMALDEAGLRTEGLGPEDAMAWVMPGRQAADDYQRAAQTRWGRRQLVYTNGSGEVIAVTDVRGDPVYPEEE